MELLVKAAVDNELNQEICISYFEDKETGDIRCGWYTE